ncbi:hypothetical protein HD554DRAFT_2034472 [Boletus coccyginus]|nr:hypothetical protein HD554DRAFT_2034472 [Boletus coccyginus]
MPVQRSQRSIRINGLSKSITLHSFNGWCRQTTVLRAATQSECLQEINEKRAAEIQALPPDKQEMVQIMLEDQGVDAAASSFYSPDLDGFEDVSENSEAEEDDRDCRDRIELQSDQWSMQMPQLVSTYLEYRSHDTGDGFPPESNEAGELPPPFTLNDIELIDLFGCSPAFPSIAISLRTLSAFRQAHRVCPRFSIQAQCKALCHLHNVLYRPYLSTIFSNAYDVYLELLHQVEQCISAFMQHDSQDWHLRNECPACFYCLEDEPQLSKEDVDKFKYEVKSTMTVHCDTTECHDDDWDTQPGGDSDISRMFNCVNRWRNARADVHAKTFNVFTESGIFIATCRHRFVLLACDMIKSGECSIADKIRTLNLHFMVGAFHGHTHNCLCQLDWHPLYIEGIGNTEGKARFIHNHYREASQLVHVLTAELALIKATFNLTEEDFSRFLQEERAYLTSLKQPPPLELLKIQYTQMLDEVEERRKAWMAARQTCATALNDVAVGDYLTITLGMRQAQLLGLESPWKVGDEEYNKYKNKVGLGKYCAALDELERLVVMSLFELSKLSLSGTVSWKDITKYSFLGEFDLLCHSRTDVREHEWAKPAICEATTKYFKLCCAKEEIIRLDIEMRHLRTAIHDEEMKVSDAIAKLLETDPPLGRELQRLHHARTATGFRKNMVRAHMLVSESMIDGKARTGDDEEHPQIAGGGELVDAEQLQQEDPMARLARDMDDLYDLYINDPGDDDLVEAEESMAGLQTMADFMYDITD